jgi:hypothetical protein
MFPSSSSKVSLDNASLLLTILFAVTPTKYNTGLRGDTLSLHKVEGLIIVEKSHLDHVGNGHAGSL